MSSVFAQIFTHFNSFLQFFEYFCASDYMLWSGECRATMEFAVCRKIIQGVTYQAASVFKAGLG